MDRAAQPKHLSMGGTQYSKADVDKLMANLEDMESMVRRDGCVRPRCGALTTHP